MPNFFPDYKSSAKAILNEVLLVSDFILEGDQKKKKL